MCTPPKSAKVTTPHPHPTARHTPAAALTSGDPALVASRSSGSSTAVLSGGAAAAAAAAASARDLSAAPAAASAPAAATACWAAKGEDPPLAKGEAPPLARSSAARTLRMADWWARGRDRGSCEGDTATKQAVILRNIKAATVRAACSTFAAQRRKRARYLAAVTPASLAPRCTLRYVKQCRRGHWVPPAPAAKGGLARGIQQRNTCNTCGQAGRALPRMSPPVLQEWVSLCQGGSM